MFVFWKKKNDISYTQQKAPQPLLLTVVVNIICVDVETRMHRRENFQCSVEDDAKQIIY